MAGGAPKPTGQETSAVRSGHELNEASLTRHLAANVPVFSLPLARIGQFNIGQSNPTYYLVDSTGRQYVLRKKPTGKLVATAHMIEREVQVLRALASTSVPVPIVHHFCEDVSVIGTPFYIMQFVEGRIFADPSLPHLRPAERTACFESAVRTLASLHSVDYKSVGLDKFGREGDFYKRQIARMATTTRAQEIPGKIDPLPHLDALLKWYAVNLPPDRSSLVHGDYKFDNLIFHKTDCRVIGVLDWEMATIGHPLSDLANMSLAYHAPAGTPPPLGGLDGLDNPEYGIPSLEAVHRQYAALTGMPYPLPGWQFCISFASFRMAVILQGVASRAAKGQASNPMAEMVGAFAGNLAEAAAQLAGLLAPESKL